MVEEERQRFEREDEEENGEEEIQIGNTIHLAIDTNAKWELVYLFKDLILPFWFFLKTSHFGRDFRASSCVNFYSIFCVFMIFKTSADI